MEDRPILENLPCITDAGRLAGLAEALVPWGFRPVEIPEQHPHGGYYRSVRAAVPDARVILIDAGTFEGSDEFLSIMAMADLRFPSLIVTENPAAEAAFLAALAASPPAAPFDLCRREFLAEQAGPRLSILKARGEAHRPRDPMTGLITRSGLRIGIDEALSNPIGKVTAAYILDLDRFKNVNDTFGHSAGDEVLRRAAGILLQAPDFSDRACRLGGDEFGGLIGARDRSEVNAALEALREAVSSLEIEWDKTKIRITASVGFTFLEPGMGVEDAFKQADIALYSAKALGRNQIRCHDLCWDAAEEDPGQAAAEHFENVTRVWTDRMSELIRSVGRKALEEARRGADTDGLTGLSNRAYYDRRIARELENARRSGAPLSLILFDVDDFHGVNMEYGYPSGDRALAKVAELVRNHARVTDWSARYGGEEFVIVLPGADGATAGLVAERFRQALQAAEVRALGGRPIPLTATVGVAELSEIRAGRTDDVDTAIRPEDLVQKASDRVIEGKKGGKNRVVGPGGVTAGHPPATRAEGRSDRGARLDILVVDDKEHAKLQVERALKNLGAPPAGITWVETIEDLEKLKGSRFDLAFVDFFLSKDRTYGVDAVPLIEAGTVVGYSSNASASELIAEAARKLGRTNAAALEKDKRKVESPALEDFLGAYLLSGER